MANLEKTIQKCEKPEETLLSWLSDLEKEGLYIKPVSFSRIIGLSKNKNYKFMFPLVFSDYPSSRDLLFDAVTMGVPFNLDSLEKSPLLKGFDIDHTRSFKSFKKNKLIEAAPSSINEAGRYLKILKMKGIDVKSGNLQESLPTELSSFLKDPLNELRLYLASGKLLRRCLPGWSPVHPANPRYNLSSTGWTTDNYIAESIEKIDTNHLIEFTDGICPDCYNYRLREIN